RRAAVLYRVLLLVVACTGLGSGVAGAIEPGPLPPASNEPLLKMLDEAAPRGARELSAERALRIEKIAPQVEALVAARASFEGLAIPDQYIARIDQILAIRQRIEELCDRTLAFRGEAGDV